MSTRPTGAITDGHDRVVRDPAVARAEAELAESREQVAESMMALRDEVARRTDWRGWRPGKETGGWSWR